MRLFAMRVLSIVALIAIYELSPIAGLATLVAGGAYLVVQARKRRLTRSSEGAVIS